MLMGELALPTNFLPAIMKRSHIHLGKKKRLLTRRHKMVHPIYFVNLQVSQVPIFSVFWAPPPSHRTLTHTAAFHAGSATFMVDIRPRSVPKAMAGHRAVHRSRFECCPEQCRPRVPLDLYPLFRVGVCPADTVTNSYIWTPLFLSMRSILIFIILICQWLILLINMLFRRSLYRLIKP